MTYQEALAYIYSFANFERTGVFARDSEANLRRMRVLLAALGNPHQAYTTTHIAGTKGKGSTAAFIAAALVANNIATGLYTQPDLHTFRERIQIDGQPISEAEVVALTSLLQAGIAQMDPADAAELITYELGTALAFLAFARHGVTHAVVEVGLGGRLDATNVLTPLVGVITSISMDHTAILGDTITEIATEKAGIIKPGMTVITSAQHPDALGVITAVCAERGAHLTRVGPAGTDCDFSYPITTSGTPRITDPTNLVPPPFRVHTPTGDREIQISLVGNHQRQNAAAAVAALDALRERGLPLTTSGVAAGLRATRWPARLDVVGAQPWLIVDGAHNADSILQLVTTLWTDFAFARCHIVLGIMRDKDAAAIANTILAQRDRLGSIIVTQGATPRALTPAELAPYFAAAPLVLTEPAVGAAITTALGQASPADLICVTGSLYLAGEALRWIKAHHPSPLAATIVVAGDDHTGPAE